MKHWAMLAFVTCCSLPCRQTSECGSDGQSVIDHPLLFGTR